MGMAHADGRADGSVALEEEAAAEGERGGRGNVATRVQSRVCQVKPYSSVRAYSERGATDVGVAHTMLRVAVVAALAVVVAADLCTLPMCGCGPDAENPALVQVSCECAKTDDEPVRRRRRSREKPFIHLPAL